MDHVCFTKLVNGAMNCGKIELAYSFYEKSLTEKICLNVHIYQALVEELKSSKIPEKAKMITNLEYSIADSGLYMENNSNHNNTSRFLQEKTDFENKFEERQENRQISFEMKEKNSEKSMKRDNFSKTTKVLGEHKNNYNNNNNRSQFNKENKDNFNFRNREPLENKEKTQDPPMFIGVGKKSNPPFISQKDLCSMVRVNPKNL